MPVADRTKRLLGEGLKSLTAELPFCKIRVGALCQRCGIDRRTFYYHFRDIYDLAAWIFNQTVDDYAPDADGRFRVAGLTRALTRLSEDPVFFRRALAEDTQNALGWHIMDHNGKMYEQALRSLRGGAELSQSDRFSIRYHCFGSLAMIRRWIFADCAEAPERLAELLTDAMPPAMRELYGLLDETGEEAP